MNIYDFIRNHRNDAKADDYGESAMKATKKAHDSEDPKDHHAAAFMHAKAADEHSKKGNFNQAKHHMMMAEHHQQEGDGPESEPDSER